MKPEHHAWFSLITIAAALSLCAAPGGAARYGSPALRFEENVGQTDARVSFVVRGARHRVFLTQQGATLDLDGVQPNGDAVRAAVRMRVVGARNAVRPRGEGERSSSTRYLLGDRGELRAAHFDRVRYSGVLPGVDLVYYGDPQQLEYDFVVAPGAQADSLAMRFEGAEQMRLTHAGELALHTPAGELRLRAPYAYQLDGGERKTVDARYRLLADGSVGFALGGYDRERELVIDPVLVYAGYLGGAGADIHTAVKVNELGEAYVVGATRSLDFPTTSG
ncbi:MAG: hypothetical protein KDC27_00135, partial [Acidobacteria bacterium]|nr:hypothetical protein [Acidobacteriota bacterium]